MIRLAELNVLPTARFVEQLAGIFEHSAWVGQRVADARPFGSRLQLLDQMRAAVMAAPASDRMALINAHPRLGVRGRSRQQLTDSSAAEQRRAGLDACSPEEFVLLARLNAAYEAKFQFPFILAVRGHDPKSIIANVEQRLSHSVDEERQGALTQIGLIAGYRLADAVSSDAGCEIVAMLARMPDAVSGATVAGASPLSEWMSAAGLDVTQAGDRLLGVLRSRQPASGAMVLGLHHDPVSDSLEYDGRFGCALGIAVAQYFRQQSIPLSFELAVFARLKEPLPGRLLPIADAGVWQIAAANDHLLRALLVSAGAAADACVLSMRDESAPAADGPLTAARADLAAQALQDFLRRAVF